MHTIFLKRCGATIVLLLKKKSVKTILRLGISVLLIAYLLSIANLGEIQESLKSANIWYLLIALVLNYSRMPISAYRWKIILESKGILVPLRSLTCFYFIGAFFNMFLPTVIGGDIMRGYECAKFSGRGMDSATSVVIERILGFSTLFIICWISLPFAFKLLEGTNILIIIGLISFAFICFVTILFNRRLMAITLRLSRTIQRWNVEPRLKAAYNSLHSFTTSRAVLIKAFAVSVIFQFVTIVSTYFISEALGLGVPFIYFLVVMPIIWLTLMIPISIAGFGVREGAFAFFFTKVGVSVEDALLLSLLFFGMSMVVALTGGIIYGWGGYRKRSGQVQKEHRG